MGDADGTHHMIMKNIGTRYYPFLFKHRPHMLAKTVKHFCGNSLTCGGTLFDYDGDGPSAPLPLVGQRTTSYITVYELLGTERGGGSVTSAQALCCRSALTVSLFGGRSRVP
jgi:hypothetical protein